MWKMCVLATGRSAMLLPVLPSLVASAARHSKRYKKARSPGLLSLQICPDAVSTAAKGRDARRAAALTPTPP